MHQPLNGNDSHTQTLSEPTQDIIWLFEQTNDANVHRAGNYAIDDKFNQYKLCYSVTYLNDEPALASVAWNRPMYNNIVRLVTRYCVNRKFHGTNFGKGTDVMRLDTIDHIIQQKEFCEKLGYTDFFIGRNDKSPNGKRTKQITDVVSKYTNNDWKCSTEPLLVAPNPKDPECWQYVIYNNRKDFNYEDIPI